MNIPSNVVNKKLYIKAKKDADEKYTRHSAYKSMYIVKKYKSLGGKYRGKSENKSSTSRWNKECWIQVVPYVKYGKIVACGSSNKKTKVCRPFVKVNKNTPITVHEIIKLWGKKHVISLANKKNRDMNGRIFWKTGKFYPSK
ncbi:DUF5872 domain-containing protein [bacterium]|nr:DUF5872 domain-containing protein [bacterium]